MSLTAQLETETMPGSITAMHTAVNGGDVGSIPTLAANEEWNEEEGILSLEIFKPVVPVEVSLGIKAARDPSARRELKKVFLDVLRSTADVNKAAGICKIPKSLAFGWRHLDPEFAYRWDMICKSEILPHLEAEAIRRALNGSDLLLMFMMKALDRDKYDDKVAEKTVAKPNITIQIRDVDKSLVAVASNGPIPGVNYETGRLTDGQKDKSTAVDAEFESVGVSDGPVTSTERTGEK